MLEIGSGSNFSSFFGRYCLDVNGGFTCNSGGGRWLAWCGGPALFYLYIYQRIPMLVGRHFGIEGSHPYVYLIACIFITMLMALLALKCSKK